MKRRVKHQLLGKDIKFVLQLSSKNLELSVKEERKNNLQFAALFAFYENLAVNHYLADRKTRTSSIETHVCI